MAKIENMHYTICLQLISSSGQIGLPPAFVSLEQRGVTLPDLKNLVGHSAMTDNLKSRDAGASNYY